MTRLIHPVPPLYDRCSRVLILGTFPSPQSRAQGFFYMHPQNRFWPVLAEVFGQPVPDGAQARASFALDRGIALWDVLASCEITGASDASIQNPLPNDLSPILQAARISAIFTTGKKALNLYNKYIGARIGMDAIGLPSTSPANCAVGWERLVEEYRRILVYLK